MAPKWKLELKDYHHQYWWWRSPSPRCWQQGTESVRNNRVRSFISSWQEKFSLWFLVNLPQVYNLFFSQTEMSYFSLTLSILYPDYDTARTKYQLLTKRAWPFFAIHIWEWINFTIFIFPFSFAFYCNIYWSTTTTTDCWLLTNYLAARISMSIIIINRFCCLECEIITMVVAKVHRDRSIIKIEWTTELVKLGRSVKSWR